MWNHRQIWLHALPGYLHDFEISVSNSRRDLSPKTCLRKVPGSKLDLWLPQHVLRLKSINSNGRNRSERVLTGKESVVQRESKANESPYEYNQ